MKLKKHSLFGVLLKSVWSNDSTTHIHLPRYWKSIFMPFGYIAPQHLKWFGFPKLSILSVHDKSYSRDALCALNLLSSFISVTGYWSNWTEVGFCSVSCGEGVVTIVREFWNSKVQNERQTCDRKQWGLGFCIQPDCKPSMMNIF